MSMRRGFGGFACALPGTAASICCRCSGVNSWAAAKTQAKTTSHLAEIRQDTSPSLHAGGNNPSRRVSDAFAVYTAAIALKDPSILQRCRDLCESCLVIAF